MREPVWRYNNRYCSFYCKRCYRRNPTNVCPYFLPFKCDKISKPSYVCNYCEYYKSCPLDKKVYDAAYAQRQYEKKLYNSRKGINMTPEELQELNDLISPLILKGQPLSHIFAVHADEIPVCRRTLYNYLDQRVFQARNIDLPRRVRYKKRKKKSEPRKSKNLQQVYRNRHFILISNASWMHILTLTLSKWIPSRAGVIKENVSLPFYLGVVVLCLLSLCLTVLSTV